MSKVSYNQKGYVQNRMSVRAAEAYLNDEMPLTRWTKSLILENLELLIDDSAIFDRLRKINLLILRDTVLTYSSWHHTGSYANETNFYTINEEMIDELNHGNLSSLEKMEKEMQEYRLKPKEKNITSNKVFYEVIRFSYEEIAKTGGWYKKNIIHNIGIRVNNEPWVNYEEGYLGLKKKNINGKHFSIDEVLKDSTTLNAASKGKIKRIIKAYEKNKNVKLYSQSTKKRAEKKQALKAQKALERINGVWMPKTRGLKK